MSLGRVLITGGAGVVGSTIADHAVRAGAEEVVVFDTLDRGRPENLSWAIANGPVTLVPGDITDHEQLAVVTRGIDVVFHQAAIRITQCAEEPRLAFDVMVAGTFNVAEACVASGVRKVVLASSASVYGMAEQFPTPELQHPYANRTLYGAAKLFDESLFRSFHEMYSLDYVALRYFNVYGPRMSIRGPHTEVLVRWMERIAGGEPPLILGDGSQTMDFVYVDDVARANVLAAGSPVSDEIINVGSGRETSLLELAQTLLRVMDSDLQPVHGPERSVNPVPRRAADMRRARAARFRADRRPGPRTGSPRRMVASRARLLRSTHRGCLMTATESDRSVVAPPPIPVMRPALGPEEAQAAADAVASGWVAQGPRVARFEEAFANTVGAAAGVATSSCTTALHLALVLLGVGPGDEVIVPSLSFIATANVVRYVGATPVFADVDRSTLGLTRETVAAVVTPATRAVIVVHQCGTPADLAGIHALCDDRVIGVIEDAACAAGATYQGVPIGSHSELAAFSFHPRKIITTGEGGMLVTSRDDWAVRARRLREHGMSVSAAERHASRGPVLEQYLEVGFNYRMTDIQAAVGLVQLERLQDIVDRRRELAARYQDMLAPIPAIEMIQDPPGGTTNYQSFWMLLPESFPVGRDELLAQLGEVGISARRGIMAAHLEPAYAGYPCAPLPVTDLMTSRSLILPLFHDMTDADQDRVVSALLDAAGV